MNVVMPVCTRLLSKLERKQSLEEAWGIQHPSILRATLRRVQLLPFARPDLVTAHNANDAYDANMMLCFRALGLPSLQVCLRVQPKLSATAGGLKYTNTLFRLVVAYC